ncbi:MAG: FAD-dependent oxidoreductase [Thermoanaerobaculia bacterium]
MRSQAQEALPAFSVPTVREAVEERSLDWLKRNFSCRAACPVGTNAGGYVTLSARGRFLEAYKLARRPNPLASVCGRICAHPCEAVCRRGKIDSPISIRALKRFVTEKFGTEGSASFEEILECVERPRPETSTPGSVAIIGAGPAGLSCAHDLRLMGHRVTIFEASAVAGGMLRLAIPEYRLPREVLQSEIEFIRWLGVEIHFGTRVGRDLTLEELCESYGAVFIGTGCGKGRRPPAPGGELPGVYDAVDFLAAVNLAVPLDVGERVVVIGGGNVAFDVARTARRYGGTSRPDEPHHHLAVDAAVVASRLLRRDVTMLALESFEEMPADPEEIIEASQERVEIVYRRAAKEIVGKGGRIDGLVTLEVARVFDEQGRFAPETIPGTEEELVCDTVIFATGQVADLSFLSEESRVATSPHETIVVDRATLATSRPGVFAGGDVVFGPRIAIEAVADGRLVARSIDTLLTGRTDSPPEHLLYRFSAHGYDHPFARGDYELLERGRVPTVEGTERLTFEPVEIGYDEAQARREGARCLHCWINTEFDSRLAEASECIQCRGCVDVCPEACIDLVSLAGVTVLGGGEDFSVWRFPGESGPAVLGAPGATALIKDESACIRCGLCARRCPVSCIRMEGFYRADEFDLLHPADHVV